MGPADVITLLSACTLYVHVYIWPCTLLGSPGHQTLLDPWLPTGARCPVFSTTALQDLGLQLQCPPHPYQIPVPLLG